MIRLTNTNAHFQHPTYEESSAQNCAEDKIYLPTNLYPAPSVSGKHLRGRSLVWLTKRVRWVYLYLYYKPPHLACQVSISNKKNNIRPEQLKKK